MSHNSRTPKRLARVAHLKKEELRYITEVLAYRELPGGQHLCCRLRKTQTKTM